MLVLLDIVELIMAKTQESKRGGERKIRKPKQKEETYIREI